MLRMWCFGQNRVGRAFGFGMLVGLLFVLTNCQRQATHGIHFYHWRTHSEIGEVEQDYFRQLHCQKLYIRFFDVDRQHGGITPVAKLQSFDAEKLDASYVPVVFITNRTFSGISELEICELAKNIHTLIREVATTIQLSEISELQIDCDWTESTRSAYFRFLKELKQVSGRPVSCTLRLHQIKFSQQTGVPPVDKGYLMCYATSNPTGEEQNSILDMALLKDYTAGINDYPLDFDIALPIYSWGIVTNHLGKVKLINNVSVHDLDTSSFCAVGDHRFELREDAFFRGFYLNKGFTLKVESISPVLLQEAKAYLHQKIKRPYDIVYYHLDEAFLKNYTIQNLQP